MSLSTQLTTLETSGLLRLAQLEPELEYLFRHALIQDAAYSSLLKADRRVLHRAIGQTLERLYPEQIAELASTLGFHFAAAGETEQAHKYLALAGDYALAHYANVEAEQHYRAALELGGAEAGRAHLFAGLSDALYAQARYTEAAQAYRAGIQSYQVIGDDDTAARLYARASETMFRDGEVSGALALCQEGLAIPSIAAMPDTRGLAELLHETGKAYYFNSLLDQTRSLCERAMLIAERLGLMDLQVNVLATLGLLTDQSYEAQVQTLTRAVELTEAAGVRGVPAWRARNNLASQLSRAGDFSVCLQLQQRIFETARQDGLVGFEVWALTEMTYYYLQLGEFKAMDELRLTVRRLLSSVPSMLIGPDFLAYEAMLAYYQGDTAEALRVLESARDDAQRNNILESVVWMNNVLAEASLEIGALEAATGTAQRALMGSRLPYEDDIVWAFCLLCAARVREGNLPEARRLLDDARTKAGPQPAPLSRARLALTEARLAAAERQWPKAFAAFELTAQLETQMGRRWYRAQTLREWAEAHLARNDVSTRFASIDDVDRARKLLHEALALFEEMNVPRYAALVSERLRLLDT